MAPGSELQIRFAYDGGPLENYAVLCRSFREALRALSRGNLLFAPLPRDREDPAVRSLAEFAEHHRGAGSPGELRELTRARCIFAAGDPEIGKRFNQARREILAHGSARESLIAELRDASGDAAEPDALSIDVRRGGLRDIERAARLLQLSIAGDAPEVPGPDAVSVFQTARERGLVSDDAAERLAEAAKMWRNLRGALRLVGADDFAVETAAPKTRSAIARACGQSDFEALSAVLGETASRAADDVEALVP